MKAFKLFVSVLLTCSFTMLAHAEDMSMSNQSDGEVVLEEEELVWDGIVSFVCLVQNDVYEKTWYGRALLNDGEYETWKAERKDSTLQCLKERKIIPANLCGSLFAINKNTPDDYINKLSIKYKDTLKKLKSLNECEK